ARLSGLRAHRRRLGTFRLEDDNSTRRGLKGDEKSERNTMPAQTTKAFQPAPTQLSMLALSLSALGVVFGDIGTSPLYTLKTVLDVTGGSHPEPAAMIGAQSLVLCKLVI